LFDRQGRRTSVTLQDDFGAFTISDDHNRYYPSPEMHADAAAALAHVCRQLLSGETLQPRPRSAPPRVADTPEH
jgi:hypothetical protein